jgi:hypothetical protein
MLKTVFCVPAAGGQKYDPGLLMKKGQEGTAGMNGFSDIEKNQVGRIFIY